MQRFLVQPTIGLLLIFWESFIWRSWKRCRCSFSALFDKKRDITWSFFHKTPLPPSGLVVTENSNPSWGTQTVFSHELKRYLTTHWLCPLKIISRNFAHKGLVDENFSWFNCFQKRSYIFGGCPLLWTWNISNACENVFHCYASTP